jgi:hypothetical protein
LAFHQLPLSSAQLNSHRNLNRGLQFEQRSHSTKRWEKFVARSKQQTPTSARAFLEQTQISTSAGEPRTILLISISA